MNQQEQQYTLTVSKQRSGCCEAKVKFVFCHEKQLKVVCGGCEQLLGGAREIPTQVWQSIFETPNRTVTPPPQQQQQPPLRESHSSLLYPDQTEDDFAAKVLAIQENMLSSQTPVSTVLQQVSGAFSP